MTDVHTLERELNDEILSGRILEAFERFYADDVEMREGSLEPTRGKEANRERERQFVESIGEFHGAGVTAAAVDRDTGMSEWWMDVTFKDGTRKRLEQVAVRKWRDGRVASERFYHDTAG